MAPVLIGPEYFPGGNQTDSKLLALIRKGLNKVWHASCTNKMGKADDKMAVIDSSAKVFGVNKLRVVDASAFPVLPPGHPMSTVYALAEKTADKIKAEAGIARYLAVLLEELSLPYETIFKEFDELKKEPYLSANPNGRVPAIEDPNTGLVLAESGAIIQYLVETYDKSGSLTYTTAPEKYQLYQWLHFQMSGQGPYFGQKAWFSNYHAEKVPSAEARYEAEIKRVLGVIEAHLKKTGGKYLVGENARTPIWPGSRGIVFWAGWCRS
ncbi:hypothetical protein GJ744_001148 [Endocarpon pusillum]|uniref:GST N-terminal domain-containing protein n=1 Tax=Endocarpon pusillum TaxID=364733 RepID=A0A8H7AD08_9EURO|nr:hypothetical protein GJ744_001148 [Endocarpon pusillum]